MPSVQLFGGLLDEANPALKDTEWYHLGFKAQLLAKKARGFTNAAACADKKLRLSVRQEGPVLGCSASQQVEARFARRAIRVSGHKRKLEFLVEL